MSQSREEVLRLWADTDRQIRARAEALQPALKAIIDQATDVFARLRPTAPHVRNTDESSPMWHTASMNLSAPDGLPVFDSLVVRLSGDRPLLIDKYNGTDYIGNPLWRCDYTKPIDDNLVRRTRIECYVPLVESTLPYDITVGEFTKHPFRIIGIIGDEYTGQEPYIEELSAVLSEL